ncbi:MAG: extracellular solute-binding protein [Planctomycetota bacterium]
MTSQLSSNPGWGTLTRRGAIGAMAAGGLGFAVFGPRRAREAPTGRVVIDYWEKWTGQEGEAMRAVVDAFNEGQDRIWVRYFSMSAIDQKALVSIAGGDPPDVVGLINHHLPQYVSAGALASLEELEQTYGREVDASIERAFGPDDFELSEAYYTPKIWRLMRYNGQVGGAPGACTTMALYYDRGAFRAAGLDPDRPPRTIDELDAADERLAVREGDKLVQAGFIHKEPGWWNWVWGFHFGGRLYDAESNTATAVEDENVRAYEWVQSYPSRYGSTRLVSFQSGFGNYNSAQQAFVDGKVRMVFHGSFVANVIERFKPRLDYAAAPFPVDERVYDPDRPIGLVESDVLCIPRSAKHPREAWEFVRFTQRRENLESIARRHAKPSPLRLVSDGFGEGHPNRSIDVHNRIAQSDRAFPKPVTRVWPQYEQEFNANFDAFWRAERPARDILADIQGRAQAIMDADAAKRRRRAGAGAGGRPA